MMNNRIQVCWIFVCIIILLIPSEISALEGEYSLSMIRISITDLQSENEHVSFDEPVFPFGSDIHITLTIVNLDENSNYNNLSLALHVVEKDFSENIEFDFDQDKIRSYSKQTKGVIIINPSNFDIYSISNGSYITYNITSEVNFSGTWVIFAILQNSNETQIYNLLEFTIIKKIDVDVNNYIFGYNFLIVIISLLIINKINKKFGLS